MTVVNDICAAIAIALDSEFNADGASTYEIYSEAVPQELHEPCFFIQCLNPQHEQFLGNRYNRMNQFMIQYFPKSSAYEDECADVAERMMWALEYVTCVGDVKPIRGTWMHSEVVDKVLNFSINYDLFIRKIPDAEPVMDDLHSDTKLKGDHDGNI